MHQALKKLWTVHYDRPISVETAKLLGVPFVRYGSPLVHRFAPPNQVLIWLTPVEDLVEDKWIPRPGGAERFIGDVESGEHPLYLVTIHNEVGTHD